jgi:hypothetical protein
MVVFNARAALYIVNGNVRRALRRAHAGCFPVKVVHSGHISSRSLSCDAPHISSFFLLFILFSHPHPSHYIASSYGHALHVAGVIALLLRKILLAFMFLFVILHGKQLLHTINIFKVHYGSYRFSHRTERRAIRSDCLVVPGHFNSIKKER